MSFTFPVTSPYANNPLVAIAGLTSIGTSNFFNTDKTNNIFIFENNLCVSHGRHLLRAGLHLASTQVNANTRTLFSGGYLFAGTFTGHPLADFLLGDPLFFAQCSVECALDFRRHEYTYVVEDS